jgi:hypothetical protein
VLSRHSKETTRSRETMIMSDTSVPDVEAIKIFFAGLFEWAECRITSFSLIPLLKIEKDVDEMNESLERDDE